MSDDRKILGSLLNTLMTTCPICGCKGDECSLETGEKCVLPNVLGAVCSNPRCITRAHWLKKHNKRDRRRAIPKRSRA